MPLSISVGAKINIYERRSIDTRKHNRTGARA